jgi:branched-chain amino acid aminotransferase
MGFFVSVNGLVVPAEEARISVLDNGFAFGDSVYETLRTYRGRPFRPDLHFKRLRGSAGRIGIDIPQGDAELGSKLDEVLKRSANPESYIRIMVTRGKGDISYHFERVQGPTVVIVVKPYEALPEKSFAEGVPVSVVSIRRNHPDALDPAIKSCNLLNNILAVREAQTRGALEAILLNHRGEVAEGASSNIFVARDGVLVTPPLNAGILSGITREIILELAPSKGLTIREDTVTVPDLRKAEEAFLTSTLKETCPIRTVDGSPLGDGRPGPMTLQLLRAFREYAASF